VTHKLPPRWIDPSSSSPSLLLATAGRPIQVICMRKCEGLIFFFNDSGFGRPFRLTISYLHLHPSESDSESASPTRCDSARPGIRRSRVTYCRRRHDWMDGWMKSAGAHMESFFDLCVRNLLNGRAKSTHPSRRCVVERNVLLMAACRMRTFA
jgi:hypothetical protein